MGTRIRKTLAAGVLAVTVGCGGSGGGSGSGHGASLPSEDQPKKIVALLPLTGEEAATGTALLAGLERQLSGLDAEEIQFDALDTGSDRETLQRLYDGYREPGSEQGDPGAYHEGAYEDEDVVAVLVAGSEAAATVAADSEASDLLRIACTATATELEGATNLLRMAPSNTGEGSGIYKHLLDESDASGVLRRVAVVVESDLDRSKDSHDLFGPFLGDAVVTETTVQELGGIAPPDSEHPNEPIPYPQVVGTFFLYGGTAPAVAAAIDATGADVVVFLGKKSSFLALETAVAADVEWIVSHTAFGAELLELPATVRSSSLGTAGTPGQAIQDYGADAGAYLRNLLADLKGSETAVTRQSVTGRAATFSYDGATGTKALGAAEPGWFDLLEVVDGEWSIRGMLVAE